jgi:surface antigen
MRVRRYAGAFIVSLISTAGVLAYAAPAQASSTITISGVVHCHGGAVEGVWVASSGGGSGFADVYSFKTGKNDGSSDNVRYSRKVTATLPTSITLHVGCGGSTASWKTVNYSVTPKGVRASGVLNAFCGNDQAKGPCNWPAKGKTTTYNLGEPKQCTWQAIQDFHASDAIWPYWTGDAGTWHTTAKANGWSVTTVPMSKAIVEMPGHVAWVMRLNTTSAGAFVGIHVHEMNYDGTASNPTGHVREHDYPDKNHPLTGMYYIPAP